MFGSFEKQAEYLYADHRNLRKAQSAGKAMDNALVLEYTKGGTTHCRFLTDQYLKWFDEVALKNQGINFGEKLKQYLV